MKTLKAPSLFVFIFVIRLHIVYTDPVLAHRLRGRSVEPERFSMNKTTKTTTSNRLPTLTDVPGLAQLKNLYHLAKNFPGEQIELPWEIEGSIYVLSAFCAPTPGQKGVMKSKGGAASGGATEWALTTQATLTSIPEEAWRHKTADLELIENLLAVIPRSNNTEQTTFFSKSVKQIQNSTTETKTPAQATLQPAAAGQSADQRQSKSADAASGGMNISGDLAEVDLSGVLQSIALMRSTGCLELHRSLDEVFLFFEEGVLVHALHESTLGNAKASAGDRVLLETLLWEDGKFGFKQGKKGPDRSVSRSMESLAQEAANLKEFWKHLRANGLDLDATVLRRNDLSKEQFEKTVATGLKVDQGLQQSIFLDINNKKTLSDIMSAKNNMPRSVWLPYIYNLQKLGLIKFAPKQSTNEHAQKKPLIDEMKVDKARTSMLRIESGMISYELFLHFLQLEFERVKKFPAHFFSLIVFAIHDQRTREALSVLSVSKLTDSIESCTSKIDLLAHFCDHDFVILAPYQNEQQAAALAERIAFTIKQCQLEGIQGDALKLAFGIASFPAQVQILDLLAAAESAKERAMSEGKLISLASHP